MTQMTENIYNTKEAIAAIRENPLVISDIENQTEELCLEAVSLDGAMLTHVNKPTYNICMAAVKMMALL